MKTTEMSSRYDHLEQMSVQELLQHINQEDATVPQAVSKAIPQIEQLVEGIVERMHRGGRLFYIGAGTSGRLGVVDASECPPTYGVPHGLVVGIIAGGDGAIRKSVEHAEDDEKQAWLDLAAYEIKTDDTVVGIAASGTTPYVVGGLKEARTHGLLTACITCNTDTPVSKAAEISIEAIVGPEFVTGSTRMKAGTAQKLILNMISTAVMIRIGRVVGNKMVDMQLSNNKLIDRGTRMVMDALDLSHPKANELLKVNGSVRKAIEAYKKHEKE